MNPPSQPTSAAWFADNVLRHERTLRAWLSSRFPGEHDVDDIVQEAYTKILGAREQANIASPKAFLFAIARNLALDRLRHREVLPTEPLVENESLAVLEDGEGIPEAIAHNEELELLTQAIQSLPTRCRQIITLRKVYGMSYAEIAGHLGMSENTVSAQLTIGIRKCRAFMAQCRRERDPRWP